MSKSKRPISKKSVVSPEEQEDGLMQSLCDLAIALVEREEGEGGEWESQHDALKQKEETCRKAIRKCLHQKKDDILYESIERAKDADSDAGLYLKECIEEAAGTIIFRREGDGDMEVNAFVIPFFARTVGGLDSQQCFQDQAAFDLLTKSFNSAQLESKDARVVLVSHAYHLDEIDSISFSHLNQMVREAFSSMTDKKMPATPAIARSVAGWPDSVFAADDVAVELRFLLGFSLKKTDDPFYLVPDDAAAADAYFQARAQRFRQWTEDSAPIIRRCLVTDGREIDVTFLYQDNFHSGKECGMAEYYLLQLLSELTQVMDARGLQAGELKAVVGPAEVGGRLIVRVNLHAAADGALIACCDKPCIGNDLQIEVDEACDAIRGLGMADLAMNENGRDDNRES